MKASKINLIGATDRMIIVLYTLGKELKATQSTAGTDKAAYIGTDTSK